MSSFGEYDLDAILNKHAGPRWPGCYQSDTSKLREILLSVGNNVSVVPDNLFRLAALACPDIALGNCVLRVTEDLLAEMILIDPVAVAMQMPQVVDPSILSQLVAGNPRRWVRLFPFVDSVARAALIKECPISILANFPELLSDDDKVRMSHICPASLLNVLGESVPDEAMKNCIAIINDPVWRYSDNVCP